MPEEIAKIVWDLQGLDPEETMWGYDQEQFANMLRSQLPLIPIRLHTCAIDCGDGPCYSALFKTAEGAERRQEYEKESCSGFCEAVGSIGIKVDADGNFVEGADYTHETEDYEEVYE